MELHKIFMILLPWYVAQSKTFALFSNFIQIYHIYQTYIPPGRAKNQKKLREIISFRLSYNGTVYCLTTI